MLSLIQQNTTHSKYNTLAKLFSVVFIHSFKALDTHRGDFCPNIAVVLSGYCYFRMSALCCEDQGCRREWGGGSL